MNIGIIGSGNVGGTLGRRWAQGGHQVVFASRHPDSPEIRDLVAASGPSARAGSVGEAASSDVLLIATPWEGVEQALRSAGNLAGKVILDATNPLLPNLAGLALGTSTSGAEQVAQWAAGARVVKVFNTVGYNIMANPAFDDRNAVMFYAGDDANAKKVAGELVSELGFLPVDAGPLKQARLLEPFALLWITLAHVQGHGREIGFAFLKR